ncbi:MAG: hypothetical protein ABIT10_12280 [Alteraurantiacibacter sp.]
MALSPFVERGWPFDCTALARTARSWHHPTMRKTRLAAILLAAAALASGTPLLAEDDPRNPDIVVSGEVESDEVDAGEVRQQARAVTSRGGVINEPLARFQDPVCVGVWGLSGESAGFVIDRIYYNAEAAGIALNDQPGCAANVIVAFVPEPQQEFRELVAARHQIVVGLTQDDRNRVARTQGPVLAWYLVANRTDTGEGRNGRPPTFESTQTSRLNAGMRRDMVLSVVMIDSDLLTDLDALALADYATMRALARTRPVDQDGNATGTVLALFDDPVLAPQGLTAFDRAYLASLYDGRADLPGQYALRDIDERMEREADTSE